MLQASRLAFDPLIPWTILWILAGGAAVLWIVYVVLRGKAWLFRALASPRHPLVIFLDDLQWADSASLALIEMLMSDPDLTSLLIIGAYRDNEVQAGHPLQALLESLARDQAPCRRISLSALERRSVGPLIADTLRDAVVSPNYPAGRRHPWTF